MIFTAYAADNFQYLTGIKSNGTKQNQRQALLHMVSTEHARPAIQLPEYVCSSTNALTGEGLQEGVQWLTGAFTKPCIYIT